MPNRGETRLIQVWLSQNFARYYNTRMYHTTVNFLAVSDDPPTLTWYEGRQSSRPCGGCCVGCWAAFARFNSWLWCLSGDSAVPVFRAM
jgi:hypothetical protein